MLEIFASFRSLLSSFNSVTNSSASTKTTIETNLEDRTKSSQQERNMKYTRNTAKMSTQINESKSSERKGFQKSLFPSSTISSDEKSCSESSFISSNSSYYTRNTSQDDDSDGSNSVFHNQLNKMKTRNRNYSVVHQWEEKVTRSKLKSFQVEGPKASRHHSSVQFTSEKYNIADKNILSSTSAILRRTRRSLTMDVNKEFVLLMPHDNPVDHLDVKSEAELEELSLCLNANECYDAIANECKEQTSFVNPHTPINSRSSQISEKVNTPGVKEVNPGKVVKCSYMKDCQSMKANEKNKPANYVKGYLAYDADEEDERLLATLMKPLMKYLLPYLQRGQHNEMNCSKKRKNLELSLDRDDKPRSAMNMLEKDSQNDEVQFERKRMSKSVALGKIKGQSLKGKLSKWMLKPQPESSSGVVNHEKPFISNDAVMEGVDLSNFISIQCLEVMIGKLERDLFFFQQFSCEMAEENLTRSQALEDMNRESRSRHEPDGGGSLPIATHFMPKQEVLLQSNEDPSAVANIFTSNIPTVVMGMKRIERDFDRCLMQSKECLRCGQQYLQSDPSDRSIADVNNTRPVQNVIGHKRMKPGSSSLHSSKKPVDPSEMLQQMIQIGEGDVELKTTNQSSTGTESSSPLFGEDQFGDVVDVGDSSGQYRIMNDLLPLNHAMSVLTTLLHDRQLSRITSSSTQHNRRLPSNESRSIIESWIMNDSPQLATVNGFIARQVFLHWLKKKCQSWMNNKQVIQPIVSSNGSTIIPMDVPTDVRSTSTGNHPSSLLRGYHRYLMDQWQSQSHVFDLLFDDYSVESLKECWLRTDRLRKDLDRSRLIMDRVRRRERLKRDYITMMNQESLDTKSIARKGSLYHQKRSGNQSDDSGLETTSSGKKRLQSRGSGGFRIGEEMHQQQQQPMEESSESRDGGGHAYSELYQSKLHGMS